MATKTLSYTYHPTWNVLNRGKPYEPFSWQIEHLHSKVDEGCPRIVLPCGRRSGKSTGVVAEVSREGAKPPVTVEGVEHSPIIYIIGPTSEASMRVFEPVWNAFVPSDSGDYVPPLGFMYAGHDKNRGVIFLKGGARIYRKTADDPRSLQGERVTLAIPDEAHDTNEEAWENLMPGLSDSEGRLIAIGIPKGKGRFRSYYHAGQGADPMFYSKSVSTTENPIFQKRALLLGVTPEQYIRENFAQDLTDNEFKRQYLAEWVEDDGQVFADFEKYFTGTGLNTHGPYIASLDLGKIHDFTVLYIGDIATQSFVHKERFNKIEYLDQADRLIKTMQDWNIRYVHLDKNGNETMAEILMRAGITVIPFGWTNQNKQNLVSTMVREVQRGHITFLHDDEDLKREMNLFEGTVSPGGVIKYEAPKGYYDDCVIAAALLIQKMQRAAQTSGVPERTKYMNFASRNAAHRAIDRIRTKRAADRERRIEELLSA